MGNTEGYAADSQKRSLEDRIHHLEYRSESDARPYMVELEQLRRSYQKKYGKRCPYKPRLTR
jgi:hypothetical protein